MTTPAPEGDPVVDEATSTPPPEPEPIAPPRFEHSAVVNLATTSKDVATQQLRPPAEEAARRFFGDQPWEWLSWDVDINLTGLDGRPTAWYARGTAALKEATS